jgi:DNA-binding beta-propeller fold protein YncE
MKGIAVRHSPTVRLNFVAGLIVLSLLAIGGCGQQQPVAEQKTWTFWPAPPDAPRVQFLTAYNTSEDVSSARSKFDEMLYGKTPELAIIKPYGIACWNGRIYVTDLRSPGVTVLDVRQQQTRVMGSGGAADVKKAIDIAIAPDGTKYVIDSTDNTIAVFDPAERYLRTIILPDFNPVGVAVYGSELFVADFQGAIVKVLDASSGQIVRTIGKPGPNDGEFVRPLSMRFDREGNLLVGDVFKCRIQKFTRDGKFLMAFGQIGNRAGDFVRPKHMDVDSTGLLYVVDAAFSNVQVFDQAGKVVGFFGTKGEHPGAMDLPAGICVVESDLDLFAPYVHPAFEAQRIIVVSNQFGASKISVYAAGQLKPGKTLADISTGRTNVAVGLEPTAKKPTTGPITIGRPVPTEPVMPRAATMPIQPGKE